MMVITDECINCAACIDECENDAIYEAGTEYTVDGETKPAMSDDFTFIVPELCNDCKACADVCAVDAIEEQ
jgi:ferredoxin